MSARVPLVVRVVVTDANILINLTHIGRLSLLEELPPYSFVVPEQVVCEVTEPLQRAAVGMAIASGWLEQVRLTKIGELTVYAELIQTLGAGEAACLSLAQCRNWVIASDEKRKFYRETTARLGTGRLINTAGILLHAITLGVLTVEDADRAKQQLEQRRFLMTFHSFRDLLGK
jgi:predicted nucleic acid-binding protein